MPEISANLETAVLSTWLIAEGSSFSATDVIAVIETDKAVVDYEAEADGTLLRHIAHDGQEVAVGAPIALIGQPGEVVMDVEAALVQLGETSGGPGGGPGASLGTEVDAGTLTPASTSVHAIDMPPRQFSSPLARRLANEAGLVIGEIPGTGPGGRIVRRDVLAAIDAGASAASVVPARIVAQAVQPSAASAGGPGFEDVPHTRLRRAIATRLLESKTTAPHFYVRGTAVVDDLLRMRKQINEGADVRVSVNDLLLKAMAKAHRAVPALNVIWTPDAIRSFTGVDIAVAIAAETGLVTPVLRSVESMSIRDIAVAVRDFADRAKIGKIQQHELEGGSTAISNLGMFGTEEFAAIISPPHSSILAVGASRQAPVVRGGSIEVGTVMTVTLSVDHRPVDGVQASQWMQVFLRLLENPIQILA